VAGLGATGDLAAHIAETTSSSPVAPAEQMPAPAIAAAVPDLAGHGPATPVAGLGAPGGPAAHTANTTSRGAGAPAEQTATDATFVWIPNDGGRSPFGRLAAPAPDGPPTDTVGSILRSAHDPAGRLAGGAIPTSATNEIGHPTAGSAVRSAVTQAAPIAAGAIPASVTNETGQPTAALVAGRGGPGGPANHIAGSTFRSAVAPTAPMAAGAIPAAASIVPAGVMSMETSRPKPERRIVGLAAQSPAVTRPTRVVRVALGVGPGADGGTHPHDRALGELLDNGSVAFQGRRM
jgi:hypothetical protein